jgi:hypothetical protein
VAGCAITRSTANCCNGHDQIAGGNNERGTLVTLVIKRRAKRWLVPLIAATTAGVGAVGNPSASAGITCNPLVVNDDNYTVPFGHVLSVPMPGLLANDSGTGLHVQTSWGQALGNPDPSDDTSFLGNATIDYASPTVRDRRGGFTYTPDPDPNNPFAGIDQFDYWVIDTCGDEDTATAYITVVPTVVDSTYATPVDTPLVVPVQSGFLAPDLGIDTFNLDFDTTTAAGGTVDDGGNFDGSFTYTPPLGFAGVDSFQYRVPDLDDDITYSASVHLRVGGPPAPTAVIAVAGNRSAIVSWKPPQSASPVSSYTVTASPGGISTTASSGPIFVTGLDNGTRYTFTVHANNAAGPGAESDPSKPVTPAGPPGAPMNVHGSVSGGTLTATWTTPSANGAPIKSYTVRASDVNKTTTVTTTHLGAAIRDLAAGVYTVTVRATNAAGTGTWSVPSNAVTLTAARRGYWMLGSDGSVHGFGNAAQLGSATRPVVAIASRRDGSGYWVTDARGTVSSFGAAASHGGRPPLLAGEVVSTISSTPSGEGYWLFTNRGRAFGFGDAPVFGDMRNTRLNGPIIASVATPTGRGYYMVGRDGGVFGFGDARFHGSTGGIRLNKPIVGIAPTSDNRGYWLVGSDGGVFGFDAPFRGSMGSVRLNRAINGIVAFGNGYLMVASDGGIFGFSDLPFLGSLASHPLAAPVIGITAFAAT